MTKSPCPHPALVSQGLCDQSSLLGPQASLLPIPTSSLGPAMLTLSTSHTFPCLLDITPAPSGRHSPGLTAACSDSHSWPPVRGTPLLSSEGASQEYCSSGPQPAQGDEAPPEGREPGWHRAAEGGLASIPPQELTWGHWGQQAAPPHPRLNLISAQNETKAEGTSPAQQFLNAETRSRQPLAGGRGAGGSPGQGFW